MEERRAQPRAGLTVRLHNERVNRAAAPLAMTPSQAVHLARTDAAVNDPVAPARTEADDVTEWLFDEEGAVAPAPVAPEPVAPELVAPEPAPKPVAPEPVAPEPAPKPVAPKPVAPEPVAPEPAPEPVTPPPPVAPAPVVPGPVVLTPGAHPPAAAHRSWLRRLFARKSRPARTCTWCNLPLEGDACALGHRSG